MALFQRSMYGDEPGFTNLFRMLDAFENYHGQNYGNGRQSRSRSFSPKFDVRETEKTYELHGELPGIDRQNVHIDFTEPQTVVISGHVERSYVSGTPPAGLVEDTRMSGAITEGSEPSHKATVSDENDEAAKEQGTPAAGGEVTKKNDGSPQPSQDRFWHLERSVGHFHRTFTFPVPVDEAATKAQLNNGILHVSIPKAAKRQNRRVDIE